MRALNIDCDGKVRCPSPRDSGGDKDAEIDVYSLSGAHIGHVTMDSRDSLGEACLQHKYSLLRTGKQ